MSTTTNVGCPFALVRWGGSVPGQRPRTKLAFLESAVAENGRIGAYRGRVWRGKQWATTQRRFDVADILKRWKYPPRAATLQRARLALRKTPIEDEGPNAC